MLEQVSKIPYRENYLHMHAHRDFGFVEPVLDVAQGEMADPLEKERHFVVAVLLSDVEGRLAVPCLLGGSAAVEQEGRGIDVAAQARIV